jgi:hypothetical protein
MFKKMRNWGITVSLFFAVLGASGCLGLVVGAAAGVGGYAWIKGDLVKEFNVPAEKLHNAALRALRGMELAIMEEKSDRLSGKIRADFADGTPVWITVGAMTELSSRIKIRVGHFGDKTRSELIFNAVQKNL